MAQKTTSITHEKTVVRYSWHLILISLVFLFFYGIALYDYIMTVTLNEGYFEYLHYNQMVIDYFTNYPILPLLFWTVNVLIGTLTPLLMLMRQTISFYTSVIAFVSMLLLDIITFGFRGRWEVIGAKASTTDLVMLALTLGLCIYNYFQFKRKDV
jgi:hypothetical protein